MTKEDWHTNTSPCFFRKKETKIKGTLKTVRQSRTKVVRNCFNVNQGNRSYQTNWLNRVNVIWHYSKDDERRC